MKIGTRKEGEMADERSRQGRDRRGRGPHLRLDLSDYEKETGRKSYLVRLEAWLGGWNGPSPRVRVVVDGIPWQGQDLYPLDRQRSLSLTIGGLFSGVHTFVVATEGGECRNFRSLNIPKPEEKDPVLEAAQKAADLAALGLKKTKDDAEIKKVVDSLKPKVPDQELDGAKRNKELAELERDIAQAQRARQESEARSESRKPNKIYVTFVGERGSYRFHASSSDDKGFIPGLVIPVVDGVKITTCVADSDGTAVYDANFNEPDRYFEFRVGNEHDTIWRNRLPGPKQPKQLKLKLV